MRISLPMLWVSISGCGASSLTERTDPPPSAVSTRCAPADRIAQHADADADGFGVGAASVVCLGTPGWARVDGDCDDRNPEISPVGVEVCDGVDNDCNGQIDDAPSATQWFVDEDGDGFGAQPTAPSCAPPPGAVMVDGDCDDGDADIHPSAREVCDTIDNDCNGFIDLNDDGLDASTLFVHFADHDADGFGNRHTALVGCSVPEGRVEDGSDCADQNAARSPLAPEVCNDVDDDCDGRVDDEDPSLATGFIWYADQDGDGVGDSDGTSTVACLPPPGFVSVSGDCNDTDPTYTTEALWRRDDDADGFGAGDPVWSCGPPDTGYVIQGPTDCDDADPLRSPAMVEACGGGDDDCDGLIDEEDPSLVADVWYPDRDQDGFGDRSQPIASCEQPPGTQADGSDCDDRDSSIHPLADEVCDEIDNDCDGATDDDDPDVDIRTGRLWFGDDDRDGHGTTDQTIQSCTRPPGYAYTPFDCDDDNDDVHPDAPERCGDGLDNDCVGGDRDCDDLFVGAFAVSDGPHGSTSPPVLSCIEACAFVFGGVADDYACSTDPNGTIDRRGYLSAVGLDTWCTLGVADHLSQEPEPDAGYSCETLGCAASAYVDDQCTDAVNLCYQREQVPPL